MNWKSKRVLAMAGAGLTVALGAGVGVAATQSGPAGDSPESFLSDVAGRVGVTPQELLDAVKAEAIERIDQAVQDGRLDADRAAELKKHLEDAQFRFFAPGLIGDHGPVPFLDVAADYLGVDRDTLRSRLADGESLADIAKASGKSVDGLVDAIVADATERLDENVAAGDLTQAEADEALAELREHVTELVQNTRIGHGLGGGLRDRFGGPFDRHFGGGHGEALPGA